MKRTEKVWHLLPHNPVAVAHLATLLNVSPVVAQLLLNRQLHSPEQARRFLQVSLNDLADPEQLPGIREAAQRLYAAIRARRPICIYGDYDADGVTATAILLSVLRRLGATVTFHIPRRVEEGYGLNSTALTRLAHKGISLVVTVDCGIASIAEAAEARRLGLELLITDHHEMKEQLPAADALVHPRLPGTSYPFPELSGSGVAFKLAWAVCKLACGGERVTPVLREALLDAVALAALGTVADVVPLQAENRILVRYGLRRLQQQPNLGLQALLRCARLERKQDLTAMDIAYALAPRLNAAGRLGTAHLAVELLTCSSAQQANELARQLEELNHRRQLLERHMLRQACEQIEQLALAEAPALVLAGTGWHVGLIGIVAGRLADLYGRPALMIALPTEGDIALGSGRSAGTLPLHQALASCDDLLLTYGGHAAAAGFKLSRQHLEAFRRRFCDFAARHFQGNPPTPRLLIDAEVPLAALTPGLARTLALLEPYGPGNPPPLLLAGALQIVGEPRKVGNSERHLSFYVRQHGHQFRAIAFAMADRLEELMADGGRCCLVFTPRLDDWQGQQRIALQVHDFQPGLQARLS